MPPENRHLLEVGIRPFEGGIAQVQRQDDRILPLQLLHTSKESVPTRTGKIHSRISIARVENGFGYGGRPFGRQEIAKGSQIGVLLRAR